MELAERRAAEAKMERVVLTVHLSNQGAVKFYETLGYTPDRTGEEHQLIVTD